MSHCFFVYLLFRGLLWVYSSLILVNLNQYRGTVRVFNNCNLPSRKSYDLFYSTLLQHSLSKIYLTKILVFLPMIGIRFVICIIIAQDIRLFNGPFFKCLYFITIVFYVHRVWVYLLTIKHSGDIEENPGCSQSLVTVCLFFIET